MLAFSPAWFPTFGCPLEDDSFENYNCIETEISKSFPPFSPPQLEVTMNNSQNSAETGEDPLFVKKLSHNANERDRRKKLNNLYSSLRSLLPGTEQTKKLSIPVTISRVLKYIPELRKQVERLAERKEEILSQISRQSDITQPSNCRRGASLSSSFPTVSASRVNDKEVVIHICNLNVRSPISKVLLNLEEEGLQVMNASAFTTIGDRVFYNIYLQVMETMRMNCGMLSEKLLSLYANREELCS
ncbi:basic helix-loop-helix protein 100 [Tasmannia lanceolata]|uniref:basic helix-loop-helix protein 100 n=1 Tax=Tasmannia lanceolata TaxID=3420 RepID=UPI004064A582